MVQHPATCHLRYCHLRRINMILYHVNASLIERCHFHHSVVSVQGFPKETRAWSVEHLVALTQNWNPSLPEQRRGHADYIVSNVFDDMESFLHTTQSLNTTSAFEINKSEVDSIGVASIDYLSDHSSAKEERRRNEQGSHNDSDSSYTFTSFSSLSSQHSQHDDRLIDQTSHREGDHHDNIAHDNHVEIQSAHSDKCHDISDTAVNEFNKTSDLNESHQPGTSKQTEKNEMKCAMPRNTSYPGISISSRSKLTLETLPAMHVLEQSSSEGSCSIASSSNISLLSDSGKVMIILAFLNLVFKKCCLDMYVVNVFALYSCISFLLLY